MNEKVYIIKTYNPYIAPADGETIKFIFRLYEQQYCISEVSLYWGKPQVATPIELEDDFGYTMYDTYEDALAFVKELKEISR